MNSRLSPEAAWNVAQTGDNKSVGHTSQKNLLSQIKSVFLSILVIGFFRLSTDTRDILQLLFGNFLQLFPTFFHLAYQIKLRSRSVQILVRTMGFKIGIALQIVGQKADSAL